MRSEYNRRDFHRLTAAAVGGILAGSMIGCSEDKPKPKAPTGTGANAKHDPDDKNATKDASKDVNAVAANDWLGDVHVCRGLNACKNKGKKGTMNECAGRGECQTLAAEHGCSGMNDCKNQGGCGATAGRNECKTKGGCHVPLMEDAWKDARVAFEAAMKKAGKPVGDAPAEKKS